MAWRKVGIPTCYHVLATQLTSLGWFLARDHAYHLVQELEIPESDAAGMISSLSTTSCRPSHFAFALQPRINSPKTLPITETCLHRPGYVLGFMGRARPATMIGRIERLERNILPNVSPCITLELRLKAIEEKVF